MSCVQGHPRSSGEHKSNYGNTSLQSNCLNHELSKAIDCFLAKRTYTLPVYLKVNEECKSISDSMDGWTPSRVARVLWLAARACAWGKEDYTLNKEEEKDDADSARVAKRRRKS